MPNRLNQPWTLLVCLAIVGLLGCGQKAVDEIEAANQAGRNMHVKWQEHEFEFPARLEFDGQTWVRGRDKNESDRGVVHWHYLSTNDPNVNVRYTQWPSRSGIRESYTTFRRANKQALWRPNGKEWLIELDGARTEWTIDPKQWGLVNGPCRLYYGNGVIKFSGQQVKHLKVGQAEGYYPDGTLWWKGSYGEHGEPDYENCRYWGPDGEEMKTLNWEEKNEQYDRWRNMKSESQGV